MTCRQLFVLQCDHSELFDGRLVLRCHRELLGSEGEDSRDVRQRARDLGWKTRLAASFLERDERPFADLCPEHVLVEAER
jgi:hypothetical protein